MIDGYVSARESVSDKGCLIKLFTQSTCSFWKINVSVIQQTVCYVDNV